MFYSRFGCDFARLLHWTTFPLLRVISWLSRSHESFYYVLGFPRWGAVRLTVVNVLAVANPNGQAKEGGERNDQQDEDGDAKGNPHGIIDKGLQLRR